MSSWIAEPIPHDDGFLFEAIITANNGQQLIAQCTSFDFAKEIVDKRTRFDVELAQARAESDALATELDALHRTVNEMCGTDTSTIEAVQHVINERDAARAELAQLRAAYDAAVFAVSESDRLRRGGLPNI